MDILVDSKKLESVLSPMVKLSSSDKVRPIAGYVLCTAKGSDFVQMRAIGSDCVLSAELNCVVKSPGSGLFPIVPLNKMASSERQAVLGLKAVQDHQSEIHGSGSVIHFDTPSIDLFPESSLDDYEMVYSVSSSKFLESLRMVSVICGKNIYGKYSIDFTYVDAKAENGLHVVGTDGRSMCAYSIQCDDYIHRKDASILVPIDIVKYLSLCEVGDKVDVMVSKSWFAIACNGESNIIIAAAQGAGEYPRWENLTNIKDPVRAQFYCSSDVLSSSVKIATLALTRDFHRIKVEANSGDVKLSANGDRGIATNVNEIVDGAGEGYINLDGEMLASFLRVVAGGEQITAKIYSEEKPFVLQKEGCWIYLQMPLAVH